MTKEIKVTTKKRNKLKRSIIMIILAFGAASCDTRDEASKQLDMQRKCIEEQKKILGGAYTEKDDTPCIVKYSPLLNSPRNNYLQ